MFINKRRAQMMSWDTNEVFNFLTNQKISSKYATILNQLKLDGTHLSTFNLSDFKKLDTSIPVPKFIIIKKIRDNYLYEGLVTIKEKLQLPRKFGESVSSDLKYKQGSILMPEKPQYLNKVIREFNEFSLVVISY
nr:uncharacterized protein LOC124814915 [Hydra vulgaris]